MIEWETQRRRGFTIVELLIVIVVIGILAAITIVAFNGVQDRANDSAAQSSVQQAFKKLEAQKTIDNAYPADLATAGITDSGNTTYAYTRVESNSRACVAATVRGKVYSMQTDSQLVKGGCGQVIASYYPTTDFNGTPALVRSETSMANNWTSNSPEAGVIPADNFSAKFEAKLIPPVTGAYTFYTDTDDNARLTVNGNVVIALTSGTRAAQSAAVNLTAGVPVRIVYEMQEIGGLAYAHLSWTHPSQTSAVFIPASAFARP